MEKQIIQANSTFISPEGRARLVQFCARIAKNIDAAEDLAQETLLEAWRNEHTLRDAERRVPWLFGIARNICLRSSCITSLESLVLESTEGQHFLQVHPRIRTLPRQYIETDGRPAILTRFESIHD